MKNKWHFVFSNDWMIYNTGFGVEIINLHWEYDLRYIVFFGLCFLWEK